MQANTTTIAKVATLAMILTSGLAGSGGQGERAAAPAREKLVWLVDPAHPGPDLPPAGRSLFDFLVTERSADGRMAYHVPFPFASLIDRIERELAPPDAYPAVQLVLIPLGRSLQRAAAGSDFFAYPRAVAAVTAQPRAQKDSSGIQLKDRLYLGYHEKAAVLEVISYNEAAGRFEFQLVKDYREGGEPRVIYAKRAVCTACHQNHAPIFSRPLWEETNANPAIAARLVAEGRDFYGIPAVTGTDTPNLIDDATDRANGLSAAQWLWSEGCGPERSTEAAACRATLLTAALRHSLSGGRGFADDAQAFRRTVRHLERRWREHWPDGLAVPSADIPNRDPLRVLPRDEVASSIRTPAIGHTTLRNLAHVPARFEPLNPRPPLAVWRAHDEDILARVIADLAGFFTAPDLARLDFHLSAQPAPTTHRRTETCEFEPKAQGDNRWRIAFRCQGAIDTEGRFYVDPEGFREGSLDHLAVDGERMSGITLGAARLAADGVAFDLRRDKLSLRRRDGNALRVLRFDWRPAADPSARFTGTARLDMSEDFATVEQAIDELASASLAGKTDVLSAAPFRRAAVLPALFARLGLPALDWCCAEAAGLPPAMTDAEGELAPPTPDIPGGFLRVCAECHRSSERFPPNFLTGTAAEVEGKLLACAERIYVRLKMWELPEDARPKSAMPPVHALETLRMTPGEWVRSAERRAMLDFVAAHIASATGAQADLDRLLTRGYESLHACGAARH